MVPASKIDNNRATDPLHLLTAVVVSGFQRNMRQQVFGASFLLAHFNISVVVGVWYCGIALSSVKRDPGLFAGPAFAFS